MVSGDDFEKMNEVIMFWYCWEKMKQSTIFKLTFKTVMFFSWLFFELLYCYDISLENFFQSIFYTFFGGAKKAFGAFGGFEAWQTARFNANKKLKI